MKRNTKRIVTRIIGMIAINFRMFILILLVIVEGMNGVISVIITSLRLMAFMNNLSDAKSNLIFTSIISITSYFFFCHVFSLYDLQLLCQFNLQSACWNSSFNQQLLEQYNLALINSCSDSPIFKFNLQ